MSHRDKSVYVKDEESEQESDVLLNHSTKHPNSRKRVHLESRCLRLLPWCINGVLVLVLAGLTLRMTSQRQDKCSASDPSIHGWGKTADWHPQLH